MKWYLLAFNKYAQFSGRSRRKEYWMFQLFNLIFITIAATLDNLLGINFTPGPVSYGYIYYIYAIAALLPGIAVAVRRLHDVGKSGWFLFIALIPIVGWVWILVLFCTDSNPEENEYGPNPKLDDLDVEYSINENH